MARAVYVPVPLRVHISHPGFNCFSVLNYLGGGHDGARLRVRLCADEKVRNDFERLGHVILFNMPVPAPLVGNYHTLSLSDLRKEKSEQGR